MPFVTKLTVYILVGNQKAFRHKADSRYITKVAEDILVRNQNAFRRKADRRYIGQKPKNLSSQS